MSGQERLQPSFDLSDQIKLALEIFEADLFNTEAIEQAVEDLASLIKEKIYPLSLKHYREKYDFAPYVFPPYTLMEIDGILKEAGMVTPEEITEDLPEIVVVPWNINGTEIVEEIHQPIRLSLGLVRHKNPKQGGEIVFLDFPLCDIEQGQIEPKLPSRHSLTRNYVPKNVRLILPIA